MLSCLLGLTYTFSVTDLHPERQGLEKAETDAEISKQRVAQVRVKEASHTPWIHETFFVTFTGVLCLEHSPSSDCSHELSAGQSRLRTWCEYGKPAAQANLSLELSLRRSA
ncbi:hypothetical protein P7K49_016990 [Saguinus oedipus]|uniref:Uncharacterized protein n=1 Tax=Saguinus oedipus TaxID=9490 RepID=A0ABQ9V2A7_SAGOE|nr:hypothetical protein P7K49_016990 [Saguinus oedipus]